MTKKITLIMFLCLTLAIGAIAVSAETSTTLDADKKIFTQTEDDTQNNMENFPKRPEALPNGDFESMEMPSDEIKAPQNESLAEGESGRQFPTEFENGSFDFANRAPGDDSWRGQRGESGQMNYTIQENNAENDESTESEETNTPQNIIKNYSTPITALLLLALAFIFVIFYKRKSY